MNSDKWDKVLVIGRRNLPEWDKYQKDINSKLNLLTIDNLDDLKDEKYKFEGYDTAFCCLGGHNPMDMK